MSDRENVIKGLEICTTRPCYCKGCPYVKDCALDSQQLMEDALTLLQEQEPVRWIRIHPAQIYECSGCGQNVMTGDIKAYKYCHGCGRAVTWD